MFKEEDISTFLSNFDQSKHERMLTTFLKGFQNQYDMCKQAVDHSEPLDLKGAVHDIKSISRTIHANEIGELAENIEELVINGNFGEAYELAPTLYPMLEDAITLINNRLNDL